MNNKIQALTEKLYNEGVEKGKNKAQKIEEEAIEKEAQLLANAEKKAQQIIANAEKKAEELKKNTQAELRMFSNQSIDALKTEITNIINGKIVENSVKSAFADKDFMQKLIISLTSGFAKNQDFVIKTKDAKALNEYMAQNAKGIIEKGFKIEEVNTISTGFTLQPKDGSYKICFGEEEFINYFKEFLRPQLVEMLFDK